MRKHISAVLKAVFFGAVAFSPLRGFAREPIHIPEGTFHHLVAASEAEAFLFKVDVPEALLKLSFAISGGWGEADLVVYGPYQAVSLNTGEEIEGNEEIKEYSTPPKGEYSVLIVPRPSFADVTLTIVFTSSKVRTASEYLDQGFNPPSIDGSIGAIALQEDGRIVIGGVFTKIAETARFGLARLESDGSLDFSFDPGEGVRAVMGGESIDALLVEPDGKVIVGGSFSTIGGVTQSGLARLKSRGGVDQTFKVGLGVRKSNDTLNPNGRVRALVRQGDGKVLFGGSFTRFDRDTLLYGIGRLNSDGSLDASFDAGSGALFEDVFALAIDAQGKILVGGDFKTFQGVPRTALARLESDGSLDIGFNASIEGQGFVCVNKITILPDGKILLVGSFRSVDGFTTHSAARLENGGKVDRSFVVTALAGGSWINDCIIQNNSSVWVTGDFLSPIGSLASNLMKLGDRGAADVGFDPGSGLLLEEVGVLKQGIGKAVAGKDDALFVAGSFSFFNGVPRSNIVRLFRQGTLLPQAKEVKLAITPLGSIFELSFKSEAGWNYVLEQCSYLSGPWKALEERKGTGESLSFFVDNVLKPSEFYRIGIR